jgi:hypothetical protein
MRCWASACQRLVVPSATQLTRAQELLQLDPDRYVHLPNGFDPGCFDRRPIDRIPLWRQLLVERCIGYLAHPFKKRQTWPPGSLFSLATELDRGTRGTCSSRWMARGRLHQASKTGACLQHALQEERCRGRGHLSKESGPTTMTGWRTSTHSARVDPGRSSLSRLSIIMVEPTQDRNGDHLVHHMLSGP